MAVQFLLSAGQVALMKGMRGVLLLDARPFRDYHQGHIPGAVDFPLTEYHWVDTSPAGIRAFVNQMERILGVVGVSHDKHVVFYEETSGMVAARGVWLLHFLGYNKASMLDGGLRAWEKAGYDTATVPTPPRPTRFRAKVHPEILATKAYVSQSLGRPGTLLLDVRSKEEYDGTLVRAARGGHIPGAQNIDWQQTITREGIFRPLPELERLYLHKDIRKESEVITYCQAGYRAAHGYLVLKTLGYPNVRNYLGSWFEWGNSQDTPVEKR